MPIDRAGNRVVLGEPGSGVEAICAIARAGATVEIGDDAIAAIEDGYACLVRHAERGEAIYGVSTDLGAGVGTRVDPSDRSRQSRIPLARAVGVGRRATTAEVRAMMAARVARFCLGHSGVSAPVVWALVDMLNHGIHPIVPMTGSISEADLAPLAHIAVVLTGQGRVTLNDERLATGAEAFAAAGLALPAFGIKDGLSLISSNAASVGLACLVLEHARRVLDAHLAAIALSFEGFRASVSPLDPLAGRLRPVPGQAEAVAVIRSFIEGGDLMRPDAARRLQDPLSLRCAPSVVGACFEAMKAAWAATELELQSSDDNPAVLAREDQVLPTGNFDATHLALAFDMLGLSLARVAATAAERIMKLLSAGFSDLPRYLAPEGVGANGFGALQKTVAALTAEIGHLAMPMPFVVTPVADRVEDYASLALSVIDKSQRLIEKMRYLTSIELIVAARAVDLRGDIKLGDKGNQLFDAVRSVVPPLDADRSSGPDVEALAEEIGSGRLLAALKAG
jgi:histidine ammonia-lyase